ncbi:MAG: TRAP transporter large permease subunit [Pseudomonadota bacterium]
MLFGLDGIEIALLIVFLCLFGGIMTGFPVAFAIGGSAVISFTIIAALDSGGLLIHQAVDDRSAEYAALLAEGIPREAISVFSFPDLPRIEEPLFKRGWEAAFNSDLGQIVNRMDQRVIGGESIETLLAVLMFVMMGITLERSRIAEDLLTTMARVFGPLPGGLAVSIVVVGAFLAASTGIVGATVVTMGLLALPTMLRQGYSPELSTGVIAASGTLGQIIPPSIVIVLLGTLAGDLYAAGQEQRALLAGCNDALTLLGEPAVLSVGTLFQAALLPGILLAGLYASYAFGFALFNPSKAPPVEGEAISSEAVTRNEALTWYLGVPVLIILALIGAGQVGIAGSQDLTVRETELSGTSGLLRTNVSPECQASLIEVHGQEAWDASVEAGGAVDATSRDLSEEEIQAALDAKIASAAPIGTAFAIVMALFAIVIALARGVSPSAPAWPLALGAAGIAVALAIDWTALSPLASSGQRTLALALPVIVVLWSVRIAAVRLGQNELIRVVFPPLVLIVAVLGSILGGVTNPTPAAALGAGGAIMLAAYRKLKDENKTGRTILVAALSIVVMILLGANFDLRVTREVVPFEDWAAFIVAMAAYHVAMLGLLYGCWVLYRTSVLAPVVRETAKVTSMVFTILIGSQLLNLVVISFGGEHYIQQVLRSFEQEWVVFLLVMVILFILGFVLDFLEIIYIVVPIVGPVIYGGTLDPAWVTIMIAVNLQTSFLTPPFGFALFYLRGVAPPGITTGHIYRGILPFVLIQVVGLALLWLFPEVVTILPDLIGK